MCSFIFICHVIHNKTMHILKSLDKEVLSNYTISIMHSVKIVKI